ncbi:hypothetical protein [Natrononativus amylolyticus]|uniref:hypothetical protein n=1 Tax=Natrononativus amylolyticus TaxID=2963434 RepID=UPI0020CF9EDA|nr:hypothetical protein [Natrononativus amylolyticus]
MDKESLPRWGWLLIGLILASILANLVNWLVLFPLGLPDAYQVVTIITAMSPVLVYIGFWYDDDRSHYWEHSRAHIAGDIAFVLVGAALGSSMALVLIADAGLPTLVTDMIAMALGFIVAWGLFWWRNTEFFGGDPSAQS